MNQLLKYPGSKFKLANEIIALFPKHKFYLEPFFGSGGVFFNKLPSYRETINDIDDMVVNFFEVCRDYPDELMTKVYFTPFARSEYLRSESRYKDLPMNTKEEKIECARTFLVRCSQSYGTKLSEKVGWKNSKLSSGPNNPAIWIRNTNLIMEVCERLKKAQIECRDAIKLIGDYNFEDCLIYADPPYLKEKRQRSYYRYEMYKEDEHIRLLKALLKHQGSVVLSGDDTELYNDYLHNWNKLSFSTVAQGGLIREECIYFNFNHEPNSQLRFAINN